MILITHCSQYFLFPSPILPYMWILVSLGFSVRRSHFEALSYLTPVKQWTNNLLLLIFVNPGEKWNENIETAIGIRLIESNRYFHPFECNVGQQHWRMCLVKAVCGREWRGIFYLNNFCIPLIFPSNTVTCDDKFNTFIILCVDIFFFCFF